MFGLVFQIYDRVAQLYRTVFPKRGFRLFSWFPSLRFKTIRNNGNNERVTDEDQQCTDDETKSALSLRLVMPYKRFKKIQKRMSAAERKKQRNQSLSDTDCKTRKSRRAKKNRNVMAQNVDAEISEHEIPVINTAVKPGFFTFWKNFLMTHGKQESDGIDHNEPDISSTSAATDKTLWKRLLDFLKISTGSKDLPASTEIKSRLPWWTSPKNIIQTAFIALKRAKPIFLRSTLQQDVPVLNLPENEDTQQSMPYEPRKTLSSKNKKKKKGRRHSENVTEDATAIQTDIKKTQANCPVNKKTPRSLYRTKRKPAPPQTVKKSKEKFRKDYLVEEATFSQPDFEQNQKDFLENGTPEMVVECEEQEAVLSQIVTNADERLHHDNLNQEIDFKEPESKKKQEAIKKLTSTLQDLSKLAIAIKTRAEMEKKGLFTTKKGLSNCPVQVSGNEEDGKACDVQGAQQTLEKPGQTTATGSGETFTLPQDCTESFLLTIEHIIASLQHNAENGIKDDTVPENATPILSTATTLKLEQEHHSICAEDTQPVSFNEKLAADESMKNTFFDCLTPKQDVPLPTAVLHKGPSEESTEADTDTLHGRLSQKTLNGAANTSFPDKSMDTDADTVSPCREQEIEAVDTAINVETALENTQEEVIQAAKPATTENLLSSALPKSLIGEHCDLQPTKVLPSELETSVVERVLTDTKFEKANEMELDISPLFELVDPDLPPTESTLLAPLKSYPPVVKPGVWVVFEGPHIEPDVPPAASDELNTELNLTVRRCFL